MGKIGQGRRQCGGRISASTTRKTPLPQRRFSGRGVGHSSSHLASYRLKSGSLIARIIKGGLQAPPRAAAVSGAARVQRGRAGKGCNARGLERAELLDSPARSLQLRFARVIAQICRCVFMQVLVGAMPRPDRHALSFFFGQVLVALGPHGEKRAPQRFENFAPPRVTDKHIGLMHQREPHSFAANMAMMNMITIQNFKAAYRVHIPEIFKFDLKFRLRHVSRVHHKPINWCYPRLMAIDEVILCIEVVSIESFIFQQTLA